MNIKDEDLLTASPEKLSDDSDTQKLIKDAQEKAKSLDMPYVKTMWIETIKGFLKLAEKKKKLKEETAEKVEEICQRIEEGKEDLEVLKKTEREVAGKLRELTKELFKKI